MGEQTRNFEALIAGEFSKTRGVMVNSGSSALILAMEAFDLAPGSEVVTPALTFATTVGCIVKSGCIPVFVDVGDNDYVMDVSLIEDVITPKTKAIVAPNLMGNVVNWDAVSKIAARHNLKILEDSADILGVRYNGENLGGYSDISITSFYGSHIINCAGNGGMAMTSNERYAERMKLLRSWGRSSSLFVESEAIENRFNIDVDGVPYDAKFVFEAIGYNFEGAELGAAFGIEQYKKLPVFLQRRKDVVASHLAFFEKYAEWLELPEYTEGADTVWFAFPMKVRDAAPFTRRDVQIYLEKRNIQTRVVFTGNVVRQPGFKNIEMRKHEKGFANADAVMARGFLLGSHHGMTDQMLDHLYASFDEFAKAY
jgi:CDP-6-deoxy-D-xylo-4-hexulose-3-dehydrase